MFTCFCFVCSPAAARVVPMASALAGRGRLVARAAVTVAWHCSSDFVSPFFGRNTHWLSWIIFSLCVLLRRQRRMCHRARPTGKNVLLPVYGIHVTWARDIRLRCSTFHIWDFHMFADFFLQSLVHTHAPTAKGKYEWTKQQSVVLSMNF